MLGTGVFYRGKLEAWFLDRGIARDFAHDFSEEQQPYVEVKPLEIGILRKDLVEKEKERESNG